MKTRKKGEVGNLMGIFRIKLLTSGVTMEGGGIGGWRSFILDNLVGGGELALEDTFLLNVKFILVILIICHMGFSYVYLPLRPGKFFSRQSINETGS